MVIIQIMIPSLNLETAKSTYVCEKIIVDFHATFSSLFSEIIRGTNEEIIAHHVPNHFLIQITIINLLPVGVLQKN